MYQKLAAPDAVLGRYMYIYIHIYIYSLLHSLQTTPGSYGSKVLADSARFLHLVLLFFSPSLPRWYRAVSIDSLEYCLKYSCPVSITKRIAFYIRTFVRVLVYLHTQEDRTFMVHWGSYTPERRKAMYTDQFDALLRNGTWVKHVAPTSAQNNINVGCKCVCKLKRHTGGTKKSKLV